MFNNLREDINSVFERDPAARNVFEIVFCYPGLHALWIYRIAHWFWVNEFYFLGRFISHIGRFLTGVEIHPGAKIGRKFFIDHGMGVVIGSGAKILGPFTVGKGAKIGSNSVVVKEVPENATVVGIPGRIVMAQEKKEEGRADLQHGQLPDPEAKAIACLFDQIRELERKYDSLAKEHEELKKRLDT